MTSYSPSNQRIVSEVVIKPVVSEDGFRRCQDILVEVWNLENGGHRNIIPVRLFQVTRRYGGMVLAAENLSGDIIGFAWAFPALDDNNNLFLFSDTLGVLPQYRDQGIGSRLKLAQREWALGRNIDVIRWTFDPLEARNAYLNIARLGSLVCTYICNAYGVAASGPNKGIETDRFLSVWYLNSQRVRKHCGDRLKATPPPDLPTCLVVESWEAETIPAETRLRLDEPELLIPLPLDFQRLKAKSVALAEEWRMAMRSVCQAYFARGYAITDFHVRDWRGDRQGYYRLSRDWSIA